MRTYVNMFLGLLAAAALFASGEAVCGDGINVNITNDGTQDLYVTVYDTNARLPLIEHQRLNGFSSLPVSASADATGLANLSWTTISVDNREKRCGHGARTGLDNDATVNVHADSDCQ